jgi:hypothetical protein
MTRTRLYVVLAAGLAIILGGIGDPAAAGIRLPDPAVDEAPGSPAGTTTVVLAGGCFWGIEEVFEPEHQDFAARNPPHRYIVVIDKPKVDDLKREFPLLYK